MHGHQRAKEKPKRAEPTQQRPGTVGASSWRWFDGWILSSVNEILFFGPVCHPSRSVIKTLVNEHIATSESCALCLLLLSSDTHSSRVEETTNDGEHGTPRYPKAPAASNFSCRLCRCDSFIVTSIDVGIHVRSRSNLKPPRAADIIDTNNSHQVARPATDAERTGEGAERPAAPDCSAEWR